MSSEVTYKPVVQLRCEVQQYAWGKVGSSSQVAQLRANSDASFKVDEEKTYSELWMGSHPKAPATVVGSKDTPFIQYLESYPERCLGKAVVDEFDGKLPFLFKVLSIQKALSIQAHPTKDHGKVLHERAPDKYPDPNHKPEMAIALTPFEAMCGFRPAEEIACFFENIQELNDVIGADVCSAFAAKRNEAALKDCFSALMHCDEELVRTKLSSLVQRLEAMKTNGSFPKEVESKFVASLLLRTHGQFPGDVGCFALYFLNVINLEPGQAIFLGPNIPHAYMSGDCVECMACSDNVVRAGLTPKFKDKATLCSMLDYTMSPSQSRIFAWYSEDDAPQYHVYDPPVPEFTVISVSFSKGQHSLKPRNGPSIVLIVEGQGTLQAEGSKEPISFRRGYVLFMGPNTACSLNAQGDVALYQAVCNSPQ